MPSLHDFNKLVIKAEKHAKTYIIIFVVTHFWTPRAGDGVYLF